MAYSARLRGRSGPAARRQCRRPPALLLDRAGDLPKAVHGGGPRAGPPGPAWPFPAVPRGSARRPPRAGWEPV